MFFFYDNHMNPSRNVTGIAQFNMFWYWSLNETCLEQSPTTIPVPVGTSTFLSNHSGALQNKSLLSWILQLTVKPPSAAKCMLVKMTMHYIETIMSAVASQITGVSIVYSNVCSGADRRKYQSSMSLAFVRGIRRRSKSFKTTSWFS